jgi:hypothetical protein
MYHVELRQFPHNLLRFNLDAADLGRIVWPWVHEKALELDERKWSPHQARLTILEGPHLALEELSMGRGWRTAERESTDVTERILEEARAAMAAEGAAPRPARPTAPGEAGELLDPLALGVALASLLGPDPAGLLAAWREIVARAPGLSPSESLALAEREIASPGPAPD